MNYPMAHHLGFKIFYAFTFLVSSNYYNQSIEQRNKQIELLKEIKINQQKLISQSETPCRLR